MTDFLQGIEEQIKKWRELQELDENSTNQYRAGMAGGIKFMLDELDRFLVENARASTTKQ